ncbi:replication protein, partial [Acinetobacter nosocomialis]|nr:replication protein [Acinetobacter nosocomialis]
NPADDIDDSDLPYLEMIYKFVFGKSSYYDLAMTRHVEPQTIDRPMEKGLRRPTEGVKEGVAIEDGRGASRAERARIGAIAPQYVRKKQHWQISPYT